MIWVLREIIFVGGKYLVMKASLHLSQELILLRGKEENQIFARSRKENGNNFNFTISLSTSFFFCISHNSTNVLIWGCDILIRSIGKLFFHNKIQQSGINITRFSTSGGRSNWSANKIIVVGIGEITQLGLLLSHCDYATRLHSKTDLARKRRTEKRGE